MPVEVAELCGLMRAPSLSQIERAGPNSERALYEKEREAVDLSRADYCCNSPVGGLLMSPVSICFDIEMAEQFKSIFWCD